MLLGATFMWNYEIRFNMDNGITEFVWCNCGKERNFEQIYSWEIVEEKT